MTHPGPLQAVPEPIRETKPERMYRLRLEGNSIKAIANAVGVLPGEVEDAIAVIAAKSRERLIQELTVATVIEIDRMDCMLKALWPAATLDGDHAAIDRVLRISQERRKLLGLDAPETRLTFTKDASAAQDLSNLTLDEVRELERLQAKVVAKPAKVTRKLTARVVDKRPEAPRKGSQDFSTEPEIVPDTKDGT